MEVPLNNFKNSQTADQKEEFVDLFPRQSKYLPNAPNSDHSDEQKEEQGMNPLFDHMNNFDIPSDPQKLHTAPVVQEAIMVTPQQNNNTNNYPIVTQGWQEVQRHSVRDLIEDIAIQSKDQDIKDRKYRKTEYSFVGADSLGIVKTNITITSPQIIEKTLKSYVQYTVNTKDNYGNFQTIRRYKDFYTLYQLLSARWIGCFIPSVPSKKAVGNMNPTFIENRRRMLEHFLQKCYEIEYISRCDEFQLFIKSPNNFHDEFRKQKGMSIVDISQNYQYEFEKYSRYSVDPNAVHVLSDFMQDLQQQIKQLQLGYHQSKRSEQYFVQFAQSFETLNQQLEALRSRLHQLGEIDNKTLNAHGNPYTLIVHFFQVELSDGKAMLKVLNDRHTLVQQMEKLMNRKERQTNKLHGINAGRKSFQQLFSKKPKEHFANKIQEDIDNLDQQINAMQSLIDIVTNRILNHEIPIFKENRLMKFEGQIKKFTQTSIGEFEEIIRSIRKLEINS